MNNSTHTKCSILADGIVINEKLSPVLVVAISLFDFGTKF